MPVTSPPISFTWSLLHNRRVTSLNLRLLLDQFYSSSPEFVFMALLWASGPFARYAQDIACWLYSNFAREIQFYSTHKKLTSLGSPFPAHVESRDVDSLLSTLLPAFVWEHQKLASSTVFQHYIFQSRGIIFSLADHCDILMPSN